MAPRQPTAYEQFIGYDPKFDGMNPSQQFSTIAQGAGYPSWWPSSGVDAISKFGRFMAGAPVVDTRPVTTPGMAQPAAAKSQAWDFAVPSMFGTVTPGSLAQPRPIDPVATWAKGIGATVSSADRSAADNKRVGGAANSWHMQPGHAVDIVPPKGMTTKQLKEQLAATGQYEELIDEGDHVHVAVRGGQGGNPWVMPQPAMIDPAVANSMPMPSRPKHINLPDAPQRGANPERPMTAELPVQDWMQQMRALAPKAFDEKAAKEGRLTQVIAGIAQGAASVDARQGVGAVLAAMGAGGATAQAIWKQTTKSERKEAEEASRLFELGLVRAGIDFSKENSAIRERNAERKWQDGVDAARTTFENDTDKYRTQVQEMLANNQLDNAYLGSVDRARQMAWTTNLQLQQHNIDQANGWLSGQAGLDLKRYLYEDEWARKSLTDGGAQKTAQLATGIGLNPELVIRNAAKDPVGMNGLTGLGYMAAGNKQAAVGALARELVLSGNWQVFGTEGQKLQGLARQDPELAAAQAANWLNDPGVPATRIQQIAQLLAQQGKPMGMAFAKYMNITTAPAAKAAQPQGK